MQNIIVRKIQLKYYNSSVFQGALQGVNIIYMWNIDFICPAYSCFLHKLLLPY